MAQVTWNPSKDSETTNPSWQGLYKVGGVAALLTAVLIVLGVVTFVVWPPPPPEASVTEWFALFQHNWLVGMLGLDLVMLVSYLVLIPLLLALYIALRRTNEVLMALAATFGFIGIATYFASSRLFEMLALSQQYAAATTDVQRASLVAAGQSVLITYLGSFAAPAARSAWNYQGTAFNVSFVLWSVAGVLIAIVMLCDANFGKVIGSLGVITFVATFGLFLPVIGVYLSLIGLVVQLVWYLLIARGLCRLARRTEATTNVHLANAPA
ncbi:MAG: DUF4386 family protein [Caldilineaceae bacterium]